MVRGCVHSLSTLFLLTLTFGGFQSVASTTRLIAHYDMSEESPHPEAKIISVIEQWLQHIEQEGVNDKCLEEATLGNGSNALVTPAACDQEGATDEYTFSGVTNDQGLPNGKGTLIFTQDKRKQAGREHACLIPGTVFSSVVEEISGEFENGIPKGKMLLRWDDGGDAGGELTAELLLTADGIPHGPFLVKATQRETGVWTVGTLKTGNVTQECWVVTKEEIRYGNCTDAFVFDESAKTVVIRRHQPGDTSAKSTFVGGTVRGDQLFDAHDVALLKVQGERNCLLKLTSGIFRASFVYDLRTAERKFKLHKPGDLCPDGREVRGREDSSQALRDYFGQLKFDKVIAYPQDPEPLDRKRAKKLLSHVEKVDTESDSSNRYDALLTFLAPTMNIEFRYFGDLDTDGRFSGYAVLLVNAKQSCYRGICAVPDISRISGHFVHGILQGPVAITSGNGQATTAAVAVDGILHSLTLTMGLKLLYPHKRVEGKGKRNGVYNFNSRGVGLVTRLVGGQPKGKSWLGMVGMSESGMGFLYGELDLNRHMTGDDVAYVYPWYESALVGRFEENFMKEAKYAHVTSASCNNNLIKAEFTIQDEETTYSYDPPVQGRVSSEPLLRDPYEAENVEVRLSNIAGADDGLFTLRKLRKGQLVALYCGEHFGTDPDDTTYYRDVCAAAASTKNPCEKYSIRTHVGTTILLTDVSGYRATLAWKINNDFPPRIHTEFHDVEHPRFGLVAATTAIIDVDAGQELLINYGYKDDDAEKSGTHAWYFEQRRKREDEEKQQQLRRQRNEL